MILSILNSILKGITTKTGIIVLCISMIIIGLFLYKQKLNKIEIQQKEIIEQKETINKISNDMKQLIIELDNANKKIKIKEDLEEENKKIIENNKEKIKIIKETIYIKVNTSTDEAGNLTEEKEVTFGEWE